MLESVKISRRQSEIRQALAGLVARENPSEDETRNMTALDSEYRTNETRYRAALIAEDTERRDANRDLETRGSNKWNELVGRFELRQVALALDEGRVLDGATAEVVSELRSKGGYRGVPVPWTALEKRNTVASGTPNPMATRPIVDRIFADSAAAKMGAEMITIDAGLVEYPVCTSSVTAGWQATESGNVAGPTQYVTTDRPLTPNNTLGIQMRLSRRAMKQTGDALEQAVRRDMNGAIGVALDQAVFLGTGASGQPAGVLVGSYGITSTAIAAAASWAAFRGAVRRFMIANAAGSPSEVKLLIRPEVWDKLDGTLIASTAVSEWDRLVKNIPAQNVVTSSNALAAPSGGPPVASNALLTTNTGGVAPMWVGLWGAIDMIRDPFTDAQSGGLRITALATMDVTVSRPAQLEILTGIQ